ncbi:MAG: superfamily II DNA/RNA helicase [Saprospiraceae bacterium]|jgi:superfamily II DNA/RNA helicase
MVKSKKTKKELLSKLGIEAQNEMQLAVENAILKNSEIMISSPTGTGKTLAFLMPIFELIDDELEGVQAMIIVPTRELGIQIEQVVRQMGTGYKTNVVYGGRTIKKDKIELTHTPTIIVGTPGRMADHIRRETFDVSSVRFLVLDEFDKSLEIGFDADMEEIVEDLRNLERTILTSATTNIDIPRFIKFDDPIKLDFHDKGGAQLSLKLFESPEKDKLETLYKVLCHLGERSGIIFCNFKDSIKRVSDYLLENNIEHGIFQGGMEQQDRERALIKFRNGTHRLLIATDLAARGIDIPELDFIIHYHLPSHKHEFVHRNGRTARMKNQGAAYILKWTDEILPDFISEPPVEDLTDNYPPQPTGWQTVFVSGGRRDKISKGDIAGLFIKQGGVENDDLGIIELKEECAFVGVNNQYIEKVIEKVNNTRLKKKKVRIYKI